MHKNGEERKGKKKRKRERKKKNPRFGKFPNKSTEYRFPDSNSVGRVVVPTLANETLPLCGGNRVDPHTSETLAKSHIEEIFRYTSSDA